MPSDLDADPAAAIELCRAAHARLVARVEHIIDEQVRSPSRLPRWTVAHVLTHLARNADGHVRRLEGALHGEDVPRYPGRRTTSRGSCPCSWPRCRTGCTERTMSATLWRGCRAGGRSRPRSSLIRGDVRTHRPSAAVQPAITERRASGISCRACWCGWLPNILPIWRIGGVWASRLLSVQNRSSALWLWWARRQGWSGSAAVRFMPRRVPVGKPAASDGGRGGAGRSRINAVRLAGRLPGAVRSAGDNPCWPGRPVPSASPTAPSAVRARVRWRATCRSKVRWLRGVVSCAG